MLLCIGWSQDVAVLFSVQVLGVNPHFYRVFGLPNLCIVLLFRFVFPSFMRIQAGSRVLLTRMRRIRSSCCFRHLSFQVYWRLGSV